MNKKRVLLVVSSLEGGGAEHVAAKNLEVLEHSGVPAALLTCGSAADRSIPVYQAENCLKQDQLLSKVRGTLGSAGNASVTRRCLREFRPEIVHLHNYLPFSPSLLVELKRYRKESACRVILTHHTYSFICTNDALYQYPSASPCEKCLGRLDTTILRENCAGSRSVSAAKFLQKQRCRQAFRGLVDRHIAPSVFLKEKLLAADPSLPVEVVRNPCIDRVEPVRTDGRKNRYCYFGRIDREKNILPFAEMFVREGPKNGELLIIGDGPLCGELQKIAEQAPPGRLRVIGKFLKTEELYQQLQDCRYFVLPSVWYENSPVSIVEAVNQSLIPLVSGLGGMKELVHLLGVGHCFDPANRPDILRALWEAPFQYEKDREALGRAWKPLSLFTADAYAKRILELYFS